MSRIALCGALMILVLLSAGATEAANLTDANEIRACELCGMNRKILSYSRMLIEYDDGTKVGTCSIHCTVLDLDAHHEKGAKVLLVGDYRSKNLVEAEKAVWVIGGKKRGVMTVRAKWAFARRTDAEGFIKKNGGKLANFDDAMQAAREDAKATQSHHGSRSKGHSDQLEDEEKARQHPVSDPIGNQDRPGPKEAGFQAFQGARIKE